MGGWCFKIINILNFFVVKDKNKYFFNFFLISLAPEPLKLSFNPPPSPASILDQNIQSGYVIKPVLYAAGPPRPCPVR